MASSHFLKVHAVLVPAVLAQSPSLGPASLQSCLHLERQPPQAQSWPRAFLIIKIACGSARNTDSRTSTPTQEGGLRATSVERAPGDSDRHQMWKAALLPPGHSFKSQEPAPGSLPTGDPVPVFNPRFSFSRSKLSLQFWALSSPVTQRSLLFRP